MSLNVGDIAPDFLSDVVGGAYGDGCEVRLSDLRGERVVLVFYPKDDTPGCTEQGCAMRDDWGSLEGKARVFGVSVDGVRSHAKFIGKFDLPYPLISDESKEVVEAYGVWVEKQMYGKTYMGTERTTFVIGVDGVIEAIFRKVKPKEHLGLLLGVLG